MQRFPSAPESRHRTAIAHRGLIPLLLLRTVSSAAERRKLAANEYFTFGSTDYFSVAIKLADFDLDGDLNGDDFPDLVFANSGSMSRVYLNTT